VGENFMHGCIINYYGNDKPNNSEKAQGKKEKQGETHIIFVII